jgi:outer membrane protein TolC
MGFSQEYSFTLEEAIAFAIDSSYTTMNARRDIAIAIKQKWEATASGLPQINADINYQNLLKQPVTLIPGEITGGEPGTFVPVVFGTEQNASLFATLEQLIFDGSYLVGLQAAEAFLDFSENANEKANLEVRRGVINAYGSVLLAETIIDIFESNRQNLEKNLYETRKTFENGLAEEESVEQLEITLLDITTQLNNAKRSYVLAKELFNVSLGIDVSADVTLTETLDDLTAQNIDLEFLDQTSLSIEENVDYKIAFNLTQQRDLELKLENSFYLPRLTAFVNYGTSSFSNDFDFLRSDQPWFQSSTLGVRMSVPIFSSGLRKSRSAQARIEVDKAATNLQQVMQEVQLEFNTARNNYLLAIETYKNNKRNLDLAERIERKNQIKYSEGIATSFDLRQAQLQLYTAQREYFFSMLEVINAKADLETVMNTPQFNNQ